MNGASPSGAGASVPPFGACVPGAAAARLRDLAGRTGDGLLGRLARSVLFTAAGGRRRRPWDVTVFGTQKARLHPYDNLSEKRVLRSERSWDAEERAFVAARATRGAGAFRFLDVGANAGLHTLAARAAAEAAGRPFRAVAVEPQPEMLDRLRFNLAASGAEAEVVVRPWAAAAEAGELRLAEGAGNRGEARLAEAEGAAVAARPLLEALMGTELDGIDVLKIDVEGAEAPVLERFLADAPRALWPRAVVIEAERGVAAPPGLEPLLARGWRVAARTRMNALLTRAEA